MIAYDKCYIMGEGTVKAKVSKANKLKMLGTLFVGLLTIFIVLVFVFNRKTPESVFSAMLANNLETSTFSYVLEQEEDGLIAQIKGHQDFSDPKEPRLIMELTYSGSNSAVKGLSLKAEVKSIGNDVYARYTQFDGEMGVVSTNDFPTLEPGIYTLAEVHGIDQLNVWKKLDETVLKTKRFDAILYRYGKTNTVLGEIQMGNFANKTEILELLMSKPVLKPDFANVTSEIIDGTDTFKYAMIIELEDLNQFNVKLNELVQLNPAYLETYLNLLKTPQTESIDYTVWVDKDTKRIVRIETQDQKIYFSDYQQALSIERPAVE